MNNQISPITYFTRQTQKSMSAQTSSDVTEQNKSSKAHKYATWGLSLVALSTAAGMVYFAHENIKLNKTIKDLKKELLQPDFHTSAQSRKPKRPILQKNRPIQDKKPTAQVDIAVTELITNRINRELSEYITKRTDEKVNSEKLDQMLTKIVGESNVHERQFIPRPSQPRGRIKYYTVPGGETYVLETHDYYGKNITRVYIKAPTPEKRKYLSPDGKFRDNCHKDKKSHFQSSNKSKRWMEQSEYNNNGAKEPKN